MKRKSFIALIAGAFSMTAIAVTGALVLNNRGLSPFLTKATPKDNGSYTLTAADFTEGSGDINVGEGIAWHYNGVSVSGNVVTVGTNLYTSQFSGQTKNVSRRGNGYTRMTFADLDMSSAVGVVYHLKDVKGTLTHAAQPFSADNDLTNSGAYASADRRGLEIVQGGGSSFSFTSLTMYYDCSDVTPTVNITTASLSVGVGETGQLQAVNSDIFGGDTVTYSWSSDDTGVATVSGDSLTGTVTGVAAGTANITVTMTVNGDDYTDSLEVTVTASAATIVPVELGTGSYILGNQVFSCFDTTSTGLTAAEVTGFGLYASEVTGIENTIQSNDIQNVAGNTFRIYSPMANGAVGLNNQFGVIYDFKDSVNNKIYRASAYYDNGDIAPEIQLTAASFSVEEAATIEITAAKGFFLEGTPTSFAFESLDTDVFTVAAVDNVATVTGVAQGSATLRVTMVLNAKNYVVEKTVVVTEAGVQHLIPWYTEGTGNQAIHFDGASIWTWVNYGDLDYDGFASFSGQKANMTASYESDPATTARVEVISDDNATLHYCRVYVVLGAAYNTGTLTMTIPDAHGVTYTGTLEFNAGVLVAINNNVL